MNVQALSLSRSLLITGLLTGMALAATSSQAQDDPPPATARVSHLGGNVSIQANGVDDWGQAENNQPVGPGDRVYADQGSRGELQAAQVRAYFSATSDLTLVNINGQGVELGMATGSANIYSDGFGGNASLFVSTPNGGVTVNGRSNFRLDIYPDQQATVITNLQGDTLNLNGAGGFGMDLGAGQSVELSGTNPVYSQAVELTAPDDFGHWSGALESHRYNSPSARYVSTEMAGYDELDGNGDWQPDSDYGPIWFPHVQAGWAPYHNGHWVNRPFYGWTWVADEPWGAAPFHYGRWAQVSGRWGWIPGPREGHPVWSPAQVVFAGGVQFGGVGVSVWFPLGPGEAYKPWYPCSNDYVNRINVTNIRESRVVHVQNTYINVTNVTNVTYVNRTVGVTAMRQEDFAAGHSAAKVSVRIDPGQIAHVQVARPEARPPAQPVVEHPVVKPPAVQAARPVLINHQGQQAAAAPNARPQAVPVKATPPAPRAIPGAKPIGNPSVGGHPAGTPPASQPGQRMAQPPAPGAPRSDAPRTDTPRTPASPTPATQPARPANTPPPPPARTATPPARTTTPPAAAPREATPAQPARPQPPAARETTPPPAVRQPPPAKPQPEAQPKSDKNDKNDKKDDRKKDRKEPPPAKPE